MKTNLNIKIYLITILFFIINCNRNNEESESIINGTLKQKLGLM